MIRRVVTGLDADGRSAVLLDGALPHWEQGSAAVVWQTQAHPADNSGSADVVEPYRLDMLHTPGSTFAVCRFAPGAQALMHATDTIDYLAVLSGRVTLVTETGEAELGAGDVVADRGVLHGWRNDHAEPCLAAVVNLPALPVGAGRTV